MVLYQESRYGNPVIYDLHLVYTGLRIRKWRIRHGRRYGKLSAGFHWTRYCMAVYSRLAGATGERQLQQLPDWLRKRTWLVHLVFCMVLQKLQRTVQRSGEVWLAVLQQQQPIPSVGAVIYKTVKDKRSGKSSCGSNYYRMRYGCHQSKEI